VTITLTQISGTLPTGVMFHAATGVLSVTPATGTSGSYTLHFNTSNGVGANATQTFTPDGALISRFNVRGSPS
jgi:hypothetical protein